MAQVPGGQQTGTGPGAGSTTVAPVVYPTWTAQLLAAMGVPATELNQQAIYLWALSEGTTAANNPLAASGAGAGATTCIAQCGTSSPVYAYATLDQGIAHDAQFLQQSNYTGVIAAFKASNATLLSIWQAINASPWCKGCQGGKYPTALFTALSGAQAAVANSGAGSSATAGASSGGCTPLITTPSVAGLGGVTLLNSCQATEILGAVLIGAGGLVILVGVGIFLASSGTAKSVAGLIPSGSGGGSGGGTKSPSDDDAFEQGRSQGRRAEVRRAGRETGRREISPPVGSLPSDSEPL